MLNKLKEKFDKVLTNSEMKKVTGGRIQMYRCTEKWMGWDPVVRTCGDDKAKCETCMYTGAGCSVECVPITTE